MVKLTTQIVILLSFLIFISSCLKETDRTDSEIMPLIKNENILVKTLLFMDWSSLSSIMSSSYQEKRNLLITKLDEKCATSLNVFQSMPDIDLCWSVMTYRFLLDYGYEPERLSSMTLDDFRNTLVELNVTNNGNSRKTYESMKIDRNLKIAYQWWFTTDTATKNIIEHLNNVKDGNPVYGLKDNQGITMDVLRITKADEVYVYLGVSHAMVSDGRFKLYLSGSNDLIHWTRITELGDRSHQGDIEKWGDGYLIANEEDLIQGSNNIRIRYYSSYNDLSLNIPSFDKSIPRSLAPTAEGTPDIQRIEGGSPDNSHILIGFHYYENNVHDQQAFGILKDFSDWKVWIDVLSNQQIQEMGFLGNIGSRNSFTFGGSYVLLEAQLTPHDWSSWRILLGNGAFYYPLKLTTTLRSTSFANPGITQVGNNSFVITSFMPSQGKKIEETGELLYRIHLK